MLRILVALICAISFGWGKRLSYLDSNFSNVEVDEFEEITPSFQIKPSIQWWNSADTPNNIAITSMVVDHHSDGSWYMPSLHEKHSIGWNRTNKYSHFSNRPFACNIRFFGVGLESTLLGFEAGGTGYMTLSFNNSNGKSFWHGFDKNESNWLHCYYSTNKNTASNFIDTPKTLGVVIYCPVVLDNESGPLGNTHIGQGYFCRPLADFGGEVEIYLRPSSYNEQDAQKSADSIAATAGDSGGVSGGTASGATVATSTPIEKTVMAAIQTVPAALRMRQIRELMGIDLRPNAVCTVQTFCNPQTGPMLYLFVAYYQLMGWRVIVYDRFGLHRSFLKDLIHLPGVDYHPYTVFQLTQPTKYNREYAAELESCEVKTYYKMERNWGYKGKLADTADQDADKSRTYDHARMEYFHLDMILYIDADEIFYCPQAPSGIEGQRKFQQRLMTGFQLRGIEEMRFVRIPYSGLAPAGFVNTPENRASTDFTNNTMTCMMNAYVARSVAEMTKCWSTGTNMDDFTKSADLAGVCPFHYNHWSCTGQKGGGKDTSPRVCRCRVAFDMQNFFHFKPVLNKCHLMHFNDNKYRFQSNRFAKKSRDLTKGDVAQFNPLVELFRDYNASSK